MLALYNLYVGTRTETPRRATDLEVIRSSKLDLPWLVHGFSTRLGGVSDLYGGHALNLGFTDHDSRNSVERNRKSFLDALGADTWPLVNMRQVHSSVIHQVEAAPSDALAGDGLITRTPRLIVGIKTADCVPVLLADTRTHAVGAFHAGWRGTLARIVEKGVGDMRRHFGTDPHDLRAAIGPCIRRCCYEVESDFRDKFAAQFDYALDLFEDVASDDEVRRKYPLLFLNMRAPGHGEPPSKPHLDLVEANRRQLITAGVPPENISDIGLCTACRTDLLFSHRAEKGHTGRMMAAIGIKP